MDLNTFAKSIVDQAVGAKPVKKPASEAAVQRGKKRFASMSPEKIAENARMAAAKRWSKEKAEG